MGEVCGPGGPCTGAVAMVYRPAVVPFGIFAGAVLKNLPAALTQFAPWAYAGCAAVLVAGAVLAQRRLGRVWSWGVALAVGFGITLAAWAGSAALAAVVAPHETRPG